MIQSMLNQLMAPGTPFRISGGATALAAVKDTPPQTPAVYVFVAGERSEKDGRINATVRQKSTVDISVVVVISNLAGTNNAVAADDTETAKAYVRGRLIGFLPSGALDPLQHVEGELQQAIAGTVWFEDVFTTTRYLKETT